MLRAFAAVTLALLAMPALAHNPLAGAPLTSFGQGFLSGFGHPVLGFDHLFFVILVGIAALFTRHRFLAPLMYLVAMLGGCFVSAWSGLLPLTGLMVALSLLVLGGMLASGYRLGAPVIVSGFLGFGFFHGAAFGESLAAQEAGFGFGVLGGYLIGLLLVQYAIAIGAGLIGTMLWQRPSAASIQPRLAGAMAAGAGLLLVLEHFEGSIVRLIAA